MKYTHLSLALLASFLLLGCFAHHKVMYEIPPNYPDARRKQLEEICDKGVKLYKMHCTECHGIFSKGKDNIPDFSTTQLDNYSTRFIRRDPKNHAVAIQMSQDQLNEIMTFLRYKKANKADTAQVSPER